jgi:putative acyl-CoA dehydrogenase
MAIWEGSGNVIALDVLRTLASEPAALEAFELELGTTVGGHPLLDEHVRYARGLVRDAAADPGAAPAGARRLVEALAVALQASVLLRFAPGVSADAFVAARLGRDRGHGFGVLPRGAALGPILARHCG